MKKRVEKKEVFFNKALVFERNEFENLFIISVNDNTRRIILRRKIREKCEIGKQTTAYISLKIVVYLMNFQTLFSRN